MQKTSILFWSLLVALTLLAFYESLFPLAAETAFERFFALAAFLFLCVSLLIGPLMVLWPQRFALWLEPRRAIGLAAFGFMLAHFALVFLNFFNGNFSPIFSQFKYLVSLVALLVFLALALTSSDWAIRKMGNPSWKTLQRLIYLAFILSLVHFWLDTNGLFISVNSVVFINLAELLLLLLAGATIVFQFAGFVAKRKKGIENKTQ